eukprot:TRINITY_DN9964_c0_g1_i2.p1 TRINITY_DN9964_c0_g1~~TRINITY_DN9964_c0_g1_i2.p1  ORF type:complete len:320 (-),score=91.95 TRINITY_DN9964_c0_g1_i2:68-1027(-)
MSEEQLLQPYHHITSVPGQGFRSHLVDACNFWLKAPEAAVAQIKEIVEKLHHASLLLADVELNARLRRGIPVAHSIFGVPHTINCANYVYCLAFSEVCELERPGTVEAFRDCMLDYHRGQGQDIFWREGSRCPTEAEYEQAVVGRTGALLRLAARLLRQLSAEDSPVDLLPIADRFAVYFQIRDDYMNLAAPEFTRFKPYCEDLSQGKYSFPVIHSITTAGADDKLDRILKQRTTDPTLLRYAWQLLQRTGSFDHCRRVLDARYEELCGMLDALGGNPPLRHVLRRLHESIPEAPPADHPHAKPPPPAERRKESLPFKF